MICFCCVGCLTHYISLPLSTTLNIGDTSDDLTDVALTFCYKGFVNKGAVFKNYYQLKEGGDFVGRHDESSIKSLDYIR